MKKITFHCSFFLRTWFEARHFSSPLCYLLFTLVPVCGKYQSHSEKFYFHFSISILSVLMYGRKAEKLSGKVLECWLLLFVTIQEQFTLFRLFQRKCRGNLPKKIDAVRKGLLRVTYETENSMAISFLFPLGNPFMINSFSTCILAIDNCSIATIR